MPTPQSTPLKHLLGSIPNSENDGTSTFKALLRETSTYRYFVQMKDDAVTEGGFFDLAKVSGLRVIGAGGFLRELRRKNNRTQKEMAELAGVTRVCLTTWELNDNKALLEILVKISEHFKIDRDNIYSMIDQGKFSLSTNLPLRPQAIRDIIPYLVPHRPNNQKVTILKCPETVMLRIKTITTSIWKTQYLYQTNSKDLNLYLKAFFLYNKEYKIQPPLTNEVKHWHENSVDLIKAVIIPLLQTDGSCIENFPEFYGNNKILHDLLVDSMYFSCNVLPSSYMTHARSSNIFQTKYRNNRGKKAVARIMSMCGNIKTIPAKGQTREQYLKEPQAHINYLMEATETEQKIALRIWASAEGNVGVERDKSYIYPSLRITCTNPTVINQLKELASQFNIYFRIDKSKDTWSGFHRLSSKSIKNAINFLKIGSFIQNVEIGANSPYYESLAKDELLLGILEFKIREKKNASLRTLPIDQIHHKIRNIVLKKEYKTVDYYIQYFI